MPWIANGQSVSRLLKKTHLRRWLGRASLRRTTAYASVVPTFAALHLDLFDQPAAGKRNPTALRASRTGEGMAAVLLDRLGQRGHFARRVSIRINTPLCHLSYSVNFIPGEDVEIWNGPDRARVLKLCIGMGGRHADAGHSC